jgi:hypothetical protein
MFKTEQDIWEDLLKSLNPKYKPMFDSHERSDPEFYSLFEKWVMDDIKKGEDGCGARWVAQNIRKLKKKKFGDPVIAYYSRRFVSRHPQYRHHMELRGLSVEDVDRICLMER